MFCEFFQFAKSPMIQRHTSRQRRPAVTPSASSSACAPSGGVRSGRAAAWPVQSTSLRAEPKTAEPKTSYLDS